MRIILYKHLFQQTIIGRYVLVGLQRLWHYILSSGVARGGVWGVQTPPPIRIEAVFFTAVKLLLLNIITSL